jgi:hypothetical protein
MPAKERSIEMRGDVPISASGDEIAGGQGELRFDALEMLRRAPWGVLLVRAGRIVWLNERLASWLGAAPEDFVGAEAAEDGVGLKQNSKNKPLKSKRLRILYFAFRLKYAQKDSTRHRSKTFENVVLSFSVSARNASAACFLAASRAFFGWMPWATDARASDRAARAAARPMSG